MRDPIECMNFVQKMGFEPMFDAISTTATSIEDISFHRYFCILIVGRVGLEPTSCFRTQCIRLVPVNQFGYLPLFRWKPHYFHLVFFCYSHLNVIEEGVGFEPTEPLTRFTDFQDQPNKPLWHPSIVKL